MSGRARQFKALEPGSKNILALSPDMFCTHRGSSNSLWCLCKGYPALISDCRTPACIPMPYPNFPLLWDLLWYFQEALASLSSLLPWPLVWMHCKDLLLCPLCPQTETSLRSEIGSLSSLVMELRAEHGFRVVSRSIWGWMSEWMSKWMNGCTNIFPTVGLSFRVHERGRKISNLPPLLKQSTFFLL